MDRRDFLCRTAALSTAGLVGALDLFPLAARAATTDYKALVCVFLFGGVDGNNVLVPIDTAGYGAYTAIRGANSGIQLAQAELLPIAPLTPNTYTSFGLHPALPGQPMLVAYGSFRPPVARAYCSKSTRS